MSEGSYSFTNRLIHEKSPYLLQHAHNPVDWYPWGEEAFEKARTEDKPIFLSIGYATCHWCHVMERESFENPEIAKLLNDAFVNIKVDREELPVVDSIYMELAQALMSTAGGWPLNVILTPEGKPFFAVTYLPPKSFRGLIGIDQLIQQIQSLWKSDDRVQLVAQADKILELYKKTSPVTGEDLPTEKDFEKAFQTIFDIADPIYGGIKGEPKFPVAYQVDFLLQLGKQKSESRALFYAELTLEMMSRGGIYDHLGGGFSRYCVDERWEIPHFEKMLPDNALLAECYLQAWKLTKKDQYLRISKETLNYILREMTSPEGGFYSAQDADSENEEGRYYTWTAHEVEDILGKEDAQIFCSIYSVSIEGNFEGRNILFMNHSLKEYAELLKISLELLEKKIDQCKEKLFQSRLRRASPFKDDKIICSWNGLMIDVLAKAGASLNEEKFIAAALKAADFIKSSLWKESRLLRRYRDKDVKYPGNLDDYAFLIKGILTLFELGYGVRWLEWAIELSEILQLHFKSPNGAFFQVEKDTPILILKYEFYDGAEPSGNAVHCENLIRLYQLTQQDKFIKQAEDILKTTRSFINSFAPGACYHLIALSRYLDLKAPLFVIGLNDKKEFEQDIRLALNKQFLPHMATIWKKKDEIALLDKLMPYTADQKSLNEQTACYICRQDHCEAPLIQKEKILQAIESL